MADSIRRRENRYSLKRHVLAERERNLLLSLEGEREGSFISIGDLVAWERLFILRAEDIPRCPARGYSRIPAWVYHRRNLPRLRRRPRPPPSHHDRHPPTFFFHPTSFFSSYFCAHHFASDLARSVRLLISFHASRVHGTRPWFRSRPW